MMCALNFKPQSRSSSEEIPATPGRGWRSARLSAPTCGWVNIPRRRSVGWAPLRCDPSHAVTREALLDRLLPCLRTPGIMAAMHEPGSDIEDNSTDSDSPSEFRADPGAHWPAIIV